LRCLKESIEPRLIIGKYVIQCTSMNKVCVYSPDSRSEELIKILERPSSKSDALRLPYTINILIRMAEYYTTILCPTSTNYILAMELVARKCYIYKHSIFFENSVENRITITSNNLIWRCKYRDLEVLDRFVKLRYQIRRWIVSKCRKKYISSLPVGYPILY